MSVVDFDFRPVGDRDDCYVRNGFVIAVSDSRTGGVKPWGDMMFATEDGANMTAARCVSDVRDIVPAREVAHRTRFKASFKLTTSIILEAQS